jgi:hypothetical protein
MIVTLSGPALTYGLAWLGMCLLRSPAYRLSAYALIFASFAHLRFIQTLTGRGDELILAEQWFGITSHSIVAVLVFLIGLPPIVAAFRAISNRRRVFVFIGSWLLPLPVLVILLVSNAMLFGANGNEIQRTTFLGMSLIVFIIDLIASALLIVLAARYLRLQEKI